MKLYVGMDLHATNTYVGVVDEKNKVLHKQRFRNELPLILAGLDLPSHLFAYSTKVRPLCLERVKNGERYSNSVGVHRYIVRYPVNFRALLPLSIPLPHV